MPPSQISAEPQPEIAELKLLNQSRVSDGILTAQLTAFEAGFDNEFCYFVLEPGGERLVKWLDWIAAQIWYLEGCWVLRQIEWSGRVRIPGQPNHGRRTLWEVIVCINSIDILPLGLMICHSQQNGRLGSLIEIVPRSLQSLELATQIIVTLLCPLTATPSINQSGRFPCALG